jgi:hypothetical protein
VILLPDVYDPIYYQKNKEGYNRSSKKYYQTYLKKERKFSKLPETEFINENEYYKDKFCSCGCNQKLLAKTKDGNFSKRKKVKGHGIQKYGREVKINVLNMLGGCKCIICENSNLDQLTVDHLDNTGNLDRKYRKNIYSSLGNSRYPLDKISNLRVLCFNHNAGRTRSYLDLSYEEQTYSQHQQTKLWKEAFLFFGPCKTCGESDLKFLTISHIHNDGAERRRNGEKKDTHLITQFRKLGWLSSLKQDYCLECWNCNCGRNSSILQTQTLQEETKVQ